MYKNDVILPSDKINKVKFITSYPKPTTLSQNTEILTTPYNHICH